jgi:hypothetical protein
LFPPFPPTDAFQFWLPPEFATRQFSKEGSLSELVPYAEAPGLVVDPPARLFQMTLL